jgi:hypothetical protein
VHAPRLLRYPSYPISTKFGFHNRALVQGVCYAVPIQISNQIEFRHFIFFKDMARIERTDRVGLYATTLVVWR